MGGESSAAVVRNIQTLYDFGTANGLSDRELLGHFMSRRDASGEAAFEVLLLRHGPMVLRVCRNMLREPSDVHDAFQATFLVLVKRARSMGRIESVAGWLYGVACRVAARVRVESARRRAGEGRAALRVVEAVDSSLDEQPGIAEFGPIIQEEVNRLPQKYRAVVVLCYWQGLTHEQTAFQLGCPLGTVRSRMARARKLLHRRLSRRGFAPMASISAAGRGVDTGLNARPTLRLEAVPPELVQSTLRAASRVAAGGATAQAVSHIAATLVQQILWSTTMIKINTALVGIALFGLAGSGIWLARSNGQAVAAPAAASGEQSLAQRATSRGKPLSLPAAAVEQPPRDDQDDEPAEELPVQIQSPVEGPATVKTIVADGSKVTKGQVVCELDASEVHDQYLNQQITTKSARASYENAKLAREAAEIDVRAYEDGTYVMDLQEASGNVRIAEAELSLAEEELSAIKAKQPVDTLATKRAELAVLRAGVGLEKAQSRRRLLIDYTRGKTIKELKTAVEKARSEELTRQAAWELSASNERKIERLIDSYTIHAPIDGTLVHVTSPRFGGGMMGRGMMGGVGGGMGGMGGGFAGGMGGMGGMMGGGGAGGGAGGGMGGGRARMMNRQRSITAGAFIPRGSLLFEIVPTPQAKAEKR